MREVQLRQYLRYSKELYNALISLGVLVCYLVISEFLIWRGVDTVLPH
jgi:hypothetical protein